MRRVGPARARRAYPHAAWIEGEGLFAFLTHCRDLAISLWPTRTEAEHGEREFAAPGSCGGRCAGGSRHEVVDCAVIENDELRARTRRSYKLLAISVPPPRQNLPSGACAPTWGHACSHECFAGCLGPASSRTTRMVNTVFGNGRVTPCAARMRRNATTPSSNISTTRAD
jgi:hypothetical protein